MLSRIDQILIDSLQICEERLCLRACNGGLIIAVVAARGLMALPMIARETPGFSILLHSYYRG